MSIVHNLYHTDNCYKTNTIMLVNSFCNLKLEIINSNKLTTENQQKIISKSPTGHLPLLHYEDFFLSETKAIIMFLLHNNQDVSDILLKTNKLTDSVTVEMWINFIISNIWVLLEVIFIKDKESGKIVLDDKSDVHETAVKDLFQVLKKINDYLHFKTYMVGSSMSLADIILSACLKEVYGKVFTTENAKSLNNLTRWFKLICNLKEFKQIFGEVSFPQ
jgi:glutathione S-transferase